MTRRRALMSKKQPRLPNEYQEVEHLESTGTQYIDTGLVSNAPWKSLLYMSFNRVDVIQMFAGSYRDDSSYREIRNYLRINANGALTVHNASGTASALEGSIAVENTKYRIFGQLSDEYGRETIEINTSSFVKNSAFVANDLHIFLFAICRKVGDVTPVAGNFLYGKIYSAKVYTVANVKIADFVPCYRKADNKPGMYDLVTNTFFTNAGTGEFVVGANVNY